MALSRLLKTHLREILRLERRSVAALLPIYEQAARELTDKLIALDREGRGDTFTAQHYAAILAQLRSVLGFMRARAADTLRDEFMSAMEMGRQQGLAEIIDLERRFGDPEVAAKVNRILPVIPAQQAALLAEPQALLLSRFSGGIFTAISRELAVAMVTGESIQKAARRLAKVMEGERWQLERIARTEINQAANYGHFSTLQDVGREFPEMGLQKQWSAHLDGRTSRRCRGLHLQVRDIDQEFVAHDGWRGHFPPSHPNCRSRILPFSARWESFRRKRADTRPGSVSNPLAESDPTAGDRLQAERSNERRGFSLAPRPPS